MKQSGQAFSVFRLLIAAIVAVAILYILLSILPTDQIIGRQPNATAKTLLSERLKTPASMKISETIVFGKEANLAPRAFTNGLGITEAQVCVHKGDYIGNDDFKFVGKTLYYYGQQMNSRISVICDNADRIGEDLEDLKDDLGFDTALEAEGENVKCGEDCLSGRATCCVVILRYN